MKYTNIRVFFIPILFLIALNLHGQVYYLPSVGCESRYFKPGNYYTRAGKFSFNDKVSLAPTLGVELVLPVVKRYGIGLDINYTIGHKAVGNVYYDNMIGDDENSPIGFAAHHLYFNINNYLFINKLHIVTGVGIQQDFIYKYGALYGRDKDMIRKNRFAASIGMSYSYKKVRVAVLYMQYISQVEPSIVDIGGHSIGIRVSCVLSAFNKFRLLKNVDCPKF